MKPKTACPKTSPDLTRQTTEQSPDVTSGNTGPSIGPLGLAAYREDRRKWSLYRRHEKADTKKRVEERLVKASAGSSKKKPGFASLRPINEMDEDEPDRASRSSPKAHVPPIFADVVSRLLIAQAFDARPDLVHAVRSTAPVIVIDTSTDDLVTSVEEAARDLLFDEPEHVVHRLPDRRGNCTGILIAVNELPKARDKPAARKQALAFLSLALPIVAVSAHAPSHLTDVLLQAATARIQLPQPDARIVALAIRIMTGRRCHVLPDDAIVLSLTMDELSIAVRFDRSPRECIAELIRLAALKEADKGPRDLRLADLHGMRDAVAWAKSTLVDLAEWKKGSLKWSFVSSAIALTGPPGTGKTTFAKVFAREAGLNFMAGGMSKWQGAGHLGDLLKSMQADFATAKATRSVFLLDEFDSFPNRQNLNHDHKDYVVTVVNALLEEIDGAGGREGVILIAASNDLRRCDPALLRAGRLNHVVHIGLPDPGEIAAMMRVRLGGDLPDADLAELSELAIGATGADIEKIVSDARRIARQEKRSVELADLRTAVAGPENRSEELRYRTCVHEASHIVMDVLHNGPEDIFATSITNGSRGGISMRTNMAQRPGTYDELCKSLQIMLAGRVGEEMILGQGSHGAGGGEGSDLHIATSLAAAMAGSYGLAGPSPLVYRGAPSDAFSFLKDDLIRDAVNSELERAAASSREILEQHRRAVEAVARRMMLTGRVDGAEVARIILDLSH